MNNKMKKIFNRVLALAIFNIAVSMTASSQTIWNVCSGNTYEYAYCSITNNSNNCNTCTLSGIQGDATGYTITRGAYNGAYTTTVTWLKEGTYTLYYNCESPNGRTVTVGKGETRYAVTGSGPLCNGTRNIGIANSETGLMYGLRRNGTLYGSFKSGSNGTPLEWTVTDIGTFDVVAMYGCTQSKTNQPAVIGSAIVTSPDANAPQVFNVGGIGKICPNNSILSITLSGSQTGFNYEVYKDNVFVPGTTRLGENGSLIWNNISPSIGTFTVKAVGACESRWLMNGNVTISSNTTTSFTVGGGGSYCSGGQGLPVTLSGSQAGVSYQLKKDGVNVGTPLTGTGSPLVWSNQTLSGSYTVLATGSACDVLMTGSATIAIQSLLDGATMSNAINIGTNVGCLSYSNQKTFGAGNCYGANYGTGGDDVFYTFTTPYAISLTASHCGSAFNSQLYVLNSAGGVVAAKSIDASTNCQEQNKIVASLPAGTYFVVSKAAASSAQGVIATQINLAITESFYLSPTTSTIFEDQSVVLSAPAAMTSVTQWLPNDNTIEVRAARTITVRPGQTTTYSASGIVSGCTINATATVTVQADNTNRNYVKETVPLVKGIQAIAALDNLTVDKKLVNTSYFDGLGRANQTVGWQASFDKKDIVQPITYDKFGREALKYLPYVSNSTSGKFKLTPVGTPSTYTTSAHHAFYAAENDAVANDEQPYAQAIFDRSPLNEVIKSGMPGADWQPKTSNDNTVKKRYVVNQSGEVRQFIYDSSSGSFTTTYYQPGKLSVSITTDEHGNEIAEYTDLDGRIVLKKVQYGSNGGTRLFANTYYIYNEFGDLSFVIQPEGVAKIGSVPVDQVFLDAWAFQYQYDQQRRMIAKKVPGAAWMYMVYDDRDRLVLTQDGNQRAGKFWTFTKYDALNRPVLTGIMSIDSVLAQAKMQGRVNRYYSQLSTNGGDWFERYVGAVANNVHGYTNVSYPLTSNEQNYLTVTYYDNYNFKSMWLSGYDYESDNLSKTVGTEVYTQKANADFNQQVVGYVTGAKLKVLDSDGCSWLRSVSYYDDKYKVIQTKSDNYKGGIDRLSNLYDFVGKVIKTQTTHATLTWKDLVGVNVESNKLRKITTTTGWSTAGAASVELLAAGQSGWFECTASETNTYRMFGVSDQNTNTNYTSQDYSWYQSTNGVLYIYEGTTNRGTFGTYKPGDVLGIERTGTTIKYYYNGILKFTSPTASSGVLMADVSFYNLNATLVGVRSSITTTAKKIIRTFDYDHRGRLTHAWHQLDNGENILLAKNEYNELGQLIDKKLHSTDVNAANAKQSVDMRYNIRGWLTSINNASLNSDSNNDELNDLFGMNLSYEKIDSDLNNKSMYNGNISGMRWSNFKGETVKEKGYTFSYDAMNRLAGSFYKEKGTSWGDPGNNGFDERGFTYDLNGNITKLTRFDKKVTGFMDSLVYSYGAGTSQSNRLLRVTDYGNDDKGFIDGPNTTDDYTYDLNGNMTRDLNKGIGTTLTDNASLITYNFLNLPETITKGGNNIRYIYDATGRKLSQAVAFGGISKRSDYAGEFIYENDILQSINHEEGRIVVHKPKLIYEDHGEATSTMNASNATLALATLKGTEKYVKITASGTTARTGVFPIGGTINVAGGDRYKIRVKGYSAGTKDAYLLIKAGGADLNWPGAKLPSSMTTESWVEQTVMIPAGVTTLQVGVVWDVTVSGEIMYINELDMTKLETQTPEYQYFLRDHLGNVRLTFTTKDETDTQTATLESSNAAVEQGQFLRYSNTRRVSHYLFDKTNGSSPTTTNGAAQRLSGLANEIYGLAKSISVMPGDVVNMEVYGKYIDSNSGNRTQVLNDLIAQIAAGTAPAGTVADGTSYTSSTSSFPFPAGLNGTGSSAGSGPKAYLNWLVFDRNYNIVASKSGFKRLTTAARETGQDVAHEKLNGSVTISEPGYIYVYLSNEEGTNPYEVYFDEFKVEHIKSPVVQMDDYYPFGLTYNSYDRENSASNMYKYNGKEKQDELDLGWLDFGARMYMPEIARWGTIDPLSEKMRRWSPYAYAFNNPLKFIDPDGRKPIKPGEEKSHTVTLDVDADGVQKVTQRSESVKVVAIKKDGKIVGYSRTTTRATVTNTIRGKETGGKKTWSVEKGDVTVTSQTDRLDAKEKVVSTGTASSEQMSQSEYKERNDKNGGNSLADFEMASERVVTLSTQFQEKWHTKIMNAANNSVAGAGIVASAVSPPGGDALGGAISTATTIAARNATTVLLVEYHAEIPEGATRISDYYYRNRINNKYYDSRNPFGY